MLSTAAGDGREAEVGDADVTVAVDHHVRRLQVAVQHAALVRGGDPGADLPRDLDRLVLRKAADAAEQRRQILAVHVLHRQERTGRRRRRCRRCGRRCDARWCARCALRCGTARARPGSRSEIVGQELQRDGLSELEVVGAVDLAHAAACRAARRCGSGRRRWLPGSKRPQLGAAGRQAQRATVPRPVSRTDASSRRRRVSVVHRAISACVFPRSRWRTA